MQEISMVINVNIKDLKKNKGIQCIPLIPTDAVVKSESKRRVADAIVKIKGDNNG